MTEEMLKVQMDLPDNLVTALMKIGSHLCVDSNKLAIRLLSWKLAEETDQLFANLVKDRFDGFLAEIRGDPESLECLQGEVRKILEGEA